MQINKISQASFGKLFINIRPEELKTKALAKELNDIKNIFTQNKFDKKRWADVILNYDKEEGFYGIISSKNDEEGIPMNRDYKHPISTDKKVISSFRKWLNAWNHDYSPAILKEIKIKLQNEKKVRDFYLRKK